MGRRRKRTSFEDFIASRLEKIRSLLAPHAKVQFREGNHSYTMRMTNKTYEVQWLEAAIDYSEDYSEEDNSAWTKCDNYIWRSTVSPHSQSQRQTFLC